MTFRSVNALNFDSHTRAARPQLSRKATQLRDNGSNPCQSGIIRRRRQ